MAADRSRQFGFEKIRRISEYQQIETFPEECRNCIFARGKREMPGDAAVQKYSFCTPGQL
jgi:hypothetical protein